MKRPLGLALVVLLFLGLFVSHQFSHSAASDRVSICHFVSNKCLPNGYQLIIGHVLLVPQNQVERHLEHGDELISNAFPPACCVRRLVPKFPENG